MHFHFNLRRNTRFMQRIENICSSFSYFFLSLLPIPRIFLTYLSLLPLLFLFLSIILLSWQIYTYIRVYSIWNEASRNGQTKDKRIKDKFYSRILEGTATRKTSLRLETFELPFRLRERERERVTSMAIKWTMLTIHQFSISWNFNGTYNIAASCASTKGSRPS